MSLTISIRKLHVDARIPTYATVGAAGFDLVAVEDVIIEPGETALVRTGLAFEIPPGYEMQIRPRSGISLKTKLRVTLGTIDSDYRGEVGVIIDNADRAQKRSMSGFPMITEKGGIEYVEGTYIIRKGDRIAQAVIAPIVRANFVETDELTDTGRGEGGFGHSGVRSGVIE